MAKKKTYCVQVEGLIKLSDDELHAAGDLANLKNYVLVLRPSKTFRTLAAREAKIKVDTVSAFEF